MLERTLIQQVKEAIDVNFFKSEININTGLVKRTVHEIVKSLFAQYGSVTLAEVEQDQTMANLMVYCTSLPIDTIFNTVQQFAHFCEATKIKETI